MPQSIPRVSSTAAVSAAAAGTAAATVLAALLAFVAALAMATPAAAADAVPPHDALAAAGLSPLTDSAGPSPAPWHFSSLPRKSPTHFAMAEVDGVRGLRIEADKSYGNLVHPLTATQAIHHLSWKWRLDQANERADIRERTAEDVLVRVCVMFDMPTDHLSFGDRAWLAVARAESVDPVPSAAVCYVWDAKLDAGTVVDSPFTGRIRSIVVRGRDAAQKKWTTESRDIDADFRRLFGKESDSVPPLVGVLVGGDADNTSGHSVAWVGDLKTGP